MIFFDGMDGITISLVISICMRSNVDSPDRGGDGATDSNENEATLSSAPSTLTNDDASYMMSSPGWRRVDSIAKKTVTFACDVKDGGVVEVNDKTEESISEEYETFSRLTFVGYDAYDNNEIGTMGEEDELKEETTAAIKEESGLDDSAITSGDLISSWKVNDEDKTHRRLTFVGHDVRKEGDALAVEEEEDRQWMREKRAEKRQQQS